MNGNILTRGHGHCSSNQTGQARDKQIVAASMSRGDTQQETGGRQNAVVRAHDRRSEPPGFTCAVLFDVPPHL